nr:hypothetical protein [Bacillus atrophaeus]
MSYDKNGNRTYTWDAEDNLTAVTKKGEEKPFGTYKYDEIQKLSTERSQTTSTTETA